MLTDFDKFHEYILPRIMSGVPNTSIERAIRDGAIMLFKDSGWLTEYLPATVPLVANQTTYEIQSPEPESAICDIPRMMCNGIPVIKKERAWLDQNVEQWETQTNPTPIYYIPIRYTDASYSFQLVPYPSQSTSATNATGLMIRATMCPTDLATRLDGESYHRMRESIAAYTLRDLFGQGGQPWFDPIQETKYDAVFKSLKSQLTMQRELGDGKTVATARTGQFGVYGTFP